MVLLGQSGSRISSFTTLTGPLVAAAPRTPYTFTTTSSGLQYRIITAGAGPRPTSGQTIQAHYTGTLENGTKFDSSRDRGTPFSFTLGRGQVIAGWDEFFALAQVGDRAILRIPANLAYGSTARPGIPANSTLVFDVQLVSAT
ncbi:MAG: FKBP-type peptidyl-prolyl cis-trans isomerase [Planctomycetota bacterium]|nr:MAG: FKBP-type peptidyl-prolyl cis-trans isomerase [Planctomycetota bacterium]